MREGFGECVRGEEFGEGVRSEECEWVTAEGRGVGKCIHLVGTAEREGEGERERDLL